MFFRRQRVSPNSLEPVIQCFVRHATHSAISVNKPRIPNFSRKACHENLQSTADSRVHFTYLLDNCNKVPHFLDHTAITIEEGSEAGSFLKLLEIVEKMDLAPNTILYFLEDDYLHRKGWVDALFEAFSLRVDYVTLYDHRDKYINYPNLLSKIYTTKSCHWRTTPSTTNTYAMLFGTLKQDLSIHRRFSIGRKVTADHDKFCFLKKKGATLISSMPGFSTHVDPEFLSPCIDWQTLLEKEKPCIH